MKTILRSIFLLGILGFVGASHAADNGTADQAVAMVKKAIVAIKSDGKEKAFAAITSPEDKRFHDRDLYIFVYDLKGASLAHGNNKKMVGKSLIDLKDVEGKPLIKQMVDIVTLKGSGWVEYKWPNPVTGTVDQKSAYVEKVDDMIVGAGIYK